MKSTLFLGSFSQRHIEHVTGVVNCFLKVGGKECCSGQKLRSGIEWIFLRMDNPKLQDQRKADICSPSKLRFQVYSCLLREQKSTRVVEIINFTRARPCSTSGCELPSPATDDAQVEYVVTGDGI